MLRLLVLLAALASCASVAATASGAPRTVPCDEQIGTPRFPYAGGRLNPYRTVLDAVSVPPAHLAQVVATNEEPWRYWRKAGLVVRADGRPVTISVPEAWRSRAAIVWGNGDRPPASVLRIAGCPGAGSIGHAYAGGFLLRSPSACLPLVFRVGSRTATVRFGLGRRCD
jgi:hypothetical protein